MDFFTSAKARTPWSNIKNSYTDTFGGSTVDFHGDLFIDREKPFSITFYI